MTYVALWVPFVTLAAGVLLGAALAYWLNRVRAQEVERIRQELVESSKTEFTALSLDALKQASDQFLNLAKESLSTQTEKGEQQLEGKKALIDQTLHSIQGELQKVQDVVTQLEKDRENKFGELASQLQHAAHQTERLQTTTSQLQAALANSHARGQWGERMAEDVLRVAGFIEGVNYQKQKALKDSRPDYTFLLPRGLKVHMDVKFPLANYLAYLEADTSTEQEKARHRFLKDVRSRVKEVTGREYISREDNTVDYMIVFIPNEQVFAFIGEHDRGLWEESLRQKVILCSPMTLFSILAVIRQAVDNFYLEQRATQILEILGELRKQWTLFTATFDKMGERLQAAQKEYESLTTTRQRQLEKQLARVDELIQSDQALRMIQDEENSS